MTALLSPPVRRGLALLILLGLAWGFWTLAVAPLLTLSSARQADILALAEQLGHARALIARAPMLRERARSTDEALTHVGSFWAGTSAAAISASVQNALRPAIATSGGQIRSISDAGEADDHGFRRLTVRFDIEGSMETLQGVLLAVEAAKPSLFVDRLTVSASEGSGNAAFPPVLTLALSVSAYLRTDAPGPPS